MRTEKALKAITLMFLILLGASEWLIGQCSAPGMCSWAQIGTLSNYTYFPRVGGAVMSRQRTIDGSPYDMKKVSWIVTDSSGQAVDDQCTSSACNLNYLGAMYLANGSDPNNGNILTRFRLPSSVCSYDWEAIAYTKNSRSSTGAFLYIGDIADGPTTHACGQVAGSRNTARVYEVEEYQFDPLNPPPNETMLTLKTTLNFKYPDKTPNCPLGQGNCPLMVNAESLFIDPDPIGGGSPPPPSVCNVPNPPNNCYNDLYIITKEACTARLYKGTTKPCGTPPGSQPCALQCLGTLISPTPGKNVEFVGDAAISEDGKRIFVRNEFGCGWEYKRNVGQTIADMLTNPSSANNVVSWGMAANEFGLGETVGYYPDDTRPPMSNQYILFSLPEMGCAKSYACTGPTCNPTTCQLPGCTSCNQVGCTAANGTAPINRVDCNR